LNKKLTKEQEEVWERLKRVNNGDILGGFHWRNSGTKPPSPALTGAIFLNTTTNKIEVYDGTSWIELNS